MPFPMSQFIMPWAAGTPNPNAATANMLHSAQLRNQDRQFEEGLAQRKKEFERTQNESEFNTFGQQYERNRQFEEREHGRATTLLQWVQKMVEEDPEKAEAMAPHIKGILDIHGIQMNAPEQQQQAPGVTQEGPAEEPAPEATAPQKQTPTPTYETKVDPGTRGATRGAPQPQAVPPGMPLQAYMAENYGRGEEEAPQPVPEATPEPGQLTPSDVKAAGQQRFVERMPAQQGAPEVAPPEEVQAEMAQQGQPYQAKREAAPAEPQERSASPSWTFTYKGKQIGSIDVGRSAQMNRERAQGVGEGFNTGVLPKEDQEFVAGAIQKALQAGAITDGNSMQAYIKNVIQPELDRRSRERGSIAMARSKAASIGSGSQERLSYAEGAEQARKTLNSLGYNEVKTVLRQVPAMREKLASGNYGAVMGAIYGIARSNDPRGIVTDRDFDNAAARSLWDKLLNFFSVNDPGADPNLNEDEIRRLGELVNVMEKAANGAQARIVDAAPKTMTRMPTQDMMDGALDVFDTEFAGAQGWDSSKFGGKKKRAGAGGGGGGARTSESQRHGPLSEKGKSLLEKGP